MTLSPAGITEPTLETPAPRRPGFQGLGGLLQAHRLSNTSLISSLCSPASGYISCSSCEKCGVSLKVSFLLSFRPSFTTLKVKTVSLIVQLVKNPPAVQETPVWFLGREDLLEKGKAIPTPVFWPHVTCIFVLPYYRGFPFKGHKDNTTMSCTYCFCCVLMCVAVTAISIPHVLKICKNFFTLHFSLNSWS